MTVRTRGKRRLEEMESVGEAVILKVEEKMVDEKGTDEQKEIPTTIPPEFIEKHTEKFIGACRHVVAADPSLLPVLIAGEFSQYLRESDDSTTIDIQESFGKLGAAIIGQQISNTAARNIRGRFCDYFGGAFPSSALLYESLQAPEKRQQIKETGLSQRKLEYLESLSKYFTENSKEIDLLFNTKDNDDEVVESLVENIKGIGPWTSKMFLITGLKRANVFVPDDLGIARGFSNYASKHPDMIKTLMSNRTVVKKSKIKHKKYNWKIYDDDIMESCAVKFEPYRTLFMFLLWRMSSDDVTKMVKLEEEFMQS